MNYSATIALTIAAGVTTATQATTIHVSFDAASGASFATVDTLLDGDVVSTGTNGTDTWNLGAFDPGVAGAGTGSIADLLLDTGVSSGASLSADYRNALNLSAPFDVLGQAGADDDYALFDGVLAMNNTSDSITVTGLSSDFTSNGYTVTVYTSHADGRSVLFSIGSNTASTQQPTTALFDGDVSGFAGTITGLTSDSFTLTGVASPNALYNLAGISITAVPEPGSLALLGLGGLLIARRRR
ncbi:MAG: PEP-CTERM sorting domain-containing protein [Planctomycetota bacterium]